MLPLPVTIHVLLPKETVDNVGARYKFPVKFWLVLSIHVSPLSLLIKIRPLYPTATHVFSFPATVYKPLFATSHFFTHVLPPSMLYYYL